MQCSSPTSRILQQRECSAPAPPPEYCSRECSAVAPPSACGPIPLPCFTKIIYSTMDNEAWEKCSSTTNAVECRIEKCKQKQPIHLRWQCLAQLDTVACTKHFAADSISHRDRSETARCSMAQTGQWPTSG